MFMDLNFWTTSITAIAAIIALGISIYQIRLSNKQHLFDRRLNAYFIANGLFSLYSECKVFLKTIDKEEVLYAIEYFFIPLTNNSYLEKQAYAIQHPLEEPYHQEFFKKREELRKLAMEMQLIFKGREALFI